MYPDLAAIIDQPVDQPSNCALTIPKFLLVKIQNKKNASPFWLERTIKSCSIFLTL
jgi:hypothetical protein